jgi:hypothetical protein
MEKTLPVSEQEAELLKVAFKDNESLLKLVRALFFGFELSADEKMRIKSSFANEQLREALRKKIFPVLSKDSPIGQITDAWMGIESNVFGQPKDTIYQAVQSKQVVLEMLDKAMNLLSNPDGEPMDLKYNPNEYLIDGLQIKLLARNFYMKTVETALHFINQFANQAVVKPEEVKERRAKNSNK